MKALKNDSEIYTGQIVSSITDCYDKNAEPNNGDLMKLYAFIGQNICEQGEKAFVVHLAQTLSERLPQIKGFSPRNLRRMRDFYRTYEDQPELMPKAQILSWTQNIVILERCETEAQRSFYLNLAVEKNLSKLALMRAIATETVKTVTQENTAEEHDHCRSVLDIKIPVESVEDIDIIETACGAILTDCEPSCQGDAPPFHCKLHEIADCNDMFGNAANLTDMVPLKCVKLLIGAVQKATERILKISVYLHQAGRWERLWERHPRGRPVSPPVEFAQIYIGCQRSSYVIFLLE